MELEDVLALEKDDIENDEIAFSLINTGNGRTVYRILNHGHETHWVAKVENGSPGGTAQNQKEYEIWMACQNRPEYKYFLCPVYGLEGEILVAKYCVPLDDDDNHEATLAIPAVQALIEKFDIVGDVLERNSWGKYQGRMVLVDYGCDRQVYEDYYRLYY